MKVWIWHGRWVANATISLDAQRRQQQQLVGPHGSGVSVQGLQQKSRIVLQNRSHTTAHPIAIPLRAIALQSSFYTPLNGYDQAVRLYNAH
jgi:hypothetical protein